MASYLPGVQRRATNATLCAPPRRPDDHPRDQLAQRHAVLGRPRRPRRPGRDDVLPRRPRLVLRGHRPGDRATTRSAGRSGGPRRRSARARAPDQPAAWTIYLASDDADATAKLIVENGGSLLVEPTDIGDNGRMCVAVDTSGGVFGVWQAIETIGLEITDEPGSLVWTDARLTDPVGRQGLLRRRVRLRVPAGTRRARRLRHVPGRRPGGRRHGRDAGPRAGRPRTGWPTSRWTTSTPRWPTR